MFRIGPNPVGHAHRFSPRISTDEQKRPPPCRSFDLRKKIAAKPGQVHRIGTSFSLKPSRPTGKKPYARRNSGTAVDPTKGSMLAKGPFRPQSDTGCFSGCRKQSLQAESRRSPWRSVLSRIVSLFAPEAAAYLRALCLTLFSIAAMLCAASNRIDQGGTKWPY